MTVKALAYWVTTGLPLAIAAPLFGMMLNMPAEALGAVCLTLLAGTPGLTFIGIIGAALTVALRRGGLLLAILVIPLMVPVLIVVTSPFLQPFLILLALSLGAMVLGPIAAAAALRFGLE